MPFDGNGNFVALSPPDYPAVGGEVIYAERFNAVIDDILAGLSETLARDGQAAMTGNLPMGGFKLTGLGTGTVAGHAVEYAQWVASFANPAFTGVPTAPTAVFGTDTTQLATTAFVQDAVDQRQPVDADLTSLAALTTLGLLTRSASGTIIVRSLAAGSGVTITNADGVSGNPTISISPTLGAGDMLGPVSSVDGEAVVFDGTSGKLVRSPGGYPLVNGGAQSFTGVKTFSNGIVGDVTGNVTGDVSGNAGTATNVVANASVPTPTITFKTTRITGNTAAVNATIYDIAASLTLTLPAAPTVGDWIGWRDKSNSGTAVIARNGSLIETTADNLTLNTQKTSGMLVYSGATDGWILL